MSGLSVFARTHRNVPVARPVRAIPPEPCRPARVAASGLDPARRGIMMRSA